MPLKRFFGRGRDDTPTPLVEVEPASADEVSPPDDDGPPEEATESTWLHRADAVLPTGASTGSKRMEVLYGNDALLEMESRPGRGTRITLEMPIVDNTVLDEGRRAASR